MTGRATVLPATPPREAVIAVSYGHADKIARATATTPVADAPPIDPALYRRDDVRRILADRDIGALFRVLKDDVGLAQRTIAELVGMAQSEVSDILLKGRQVRDVTVLERICEGLGIPRGLMGLSYGERGAYGGDEVTVAEPLVSAEMLRRHLIALGAIAVVGGPSVGELLAELSSPSPVSLPSQLGGVHVVQVRDLTRRLDEAGRAYGSDPEMGTAAAARASRLLDVPGTEAARRALMVAVAELHLVAGWAGVDAGLHDRAMFHYARALELGTEVGDAYCQALALTNAGLASVEAGHPNDGLKMLQLGELKARDIPPDEQRAVVVGEGGRAAVEAQARAHSATALADLGCWDAADTALAQARELWQPTRADTYGDLDRPAACLEIERGCLDAAEPFAVASVRRWENGSSQRGRTHSGVVLATIHVRAGEPDGLR
ncbi:MAG: helix-turn-helix domain-containing protein, partial [Actinomycetota bacterium]|nr:helix-turn-helix domain-containing protein [Actinomycetota bacterium]